MQHAIELTQLDAERAAAQLAYAHAARHRALYACSSLKRMQLAIELTQ